MEPRRRRMRATYKQLKLLVKFMSDNPNLVKGVNYRTAFGKHYHDAKWQELANLLNAQENGMNKSPREWNRYWKDLKSGIKKKVQAMKKTGCSKPFLSNIEEVIYKNLCNNKFKKNAVADEKDCSYLQIPTESDHELEQYEVEYLEDTSCDETQMTDMPDIESASFDIGLHDPTLNGVKSELVDRNGQTLDLLDRDHYLIETILNESNSNGESKQDMPEEASVINNIKVKNNDINLNMNDYNSTDVLTDIRNHLRELVAVQKDRARSELRVASAHERRAILEEKRVKIEERRLKMEERKVALEERKMEALEKRSFAQERLASAAERKNEIVEHRLSNSDFVIT